MWFAAILSVFLFGLGPIDQVLAYRSPAGNRPADLCRWCAAEYVDAWRALYGYRHEDLADDQTREDARDGRGFPIVGTARECDPAVWI
jgi:hypothetical protein